MSRTNSALFAAIIFLVLIFPATDVIGQQRFYVDTDATGVNTGVTWQDAYIDLQSALLVAGSGDEIWVAEGIYLPVTPSDPGDITIFDLSKSFLVLDGVGGFGGLNGTESSLDERDIALHETILSGDLLGDDNDIVHVDEPSRVDNIWQIVKMGDLDTGTVGSNTILDGFTISGGNANPPPLHPSDAGAGLNVIGFDGDPSTPSLRNLRFESNSSRFGGAVSCFSANPTYSNITISNNFATKDGGGMSNFRCRADLRHVRFEQNVAGHRGGGIINNFGQSWLIDVQFVDNTAERGGGASNSLDTSMYLNVLFSGNTADTFGGGMDNDDSRTDIMNNVFTGNVTLEAAPFGGGGFYNHQNNIDNSPWLTNSTFSRNSSAGNGGAVMSNAGAEQVWNSILWGNEATGQGAEIFANGSQGRRPGFAFNTIAGGIPISAIDDGNNLISDPLMADPAGADDIPGTPDDNLRLTGVSPAIDMGSNALSYVIDFLDLDDDGDLKETVPLDLDTNVRIFAGLGGTATVDMGAFEYGAPPLFVAIESDLDVLPQASLIAEAYPNPFTDRVSLAIDISVAGPVTVKVFDMLGREVVTIIDRVLPAGRHYTSLHAPDLASGVYLFRVETQGASSTRKLMRVK